MEPYVHQLKRAPERAADALIARILFGEWRAGMRLPPERELAEQLRIDRTSLRAALNQLKRMNLVDVVQGSGTTVKDFVRHAGIELIAAFFAQDDVRVPATFLAEAFDAWVLVMPWVVERACARATLADFRKLSDIFARQLAALGDDDEVIALEMEAQSEIVGFIGNTMFQMLFNSTAAIRRRLVRHIVATIDTSAHIQMHTQLVEALVAEVVPRDQVAVLYREYLASWAEVVRRALFETSTA